MAVELHPAAVEHLPSFITPPGETDVLMVVTAIILAASIMGFGLLFLRLHSLPERMAHGAHPLQFEIVAVLCLIALLTHIHAFWIAALLIALVQVPDFGGWAERIAGSVERIAGRTPPGDVASQAPPLAPADAKPPEPAAAAPQETKKRAARQMEPGHA